MTNQTTSSTLATPDGARLSLHTRAQRIRHLFLLACAVGFLIVPVPWLMLSRFQGGLDVHTTIENVAALFALVTSYALVQRFYAMGNWFHLLIGVAFLVAGLRDLVHGLILVFRDVVILSTSYLIDSIDETYVTGQLVLAQLLLAALIAPARENRWTKRWRLALTIALCLGAALLLPLPGVILPEEFATEAIGSVSLVLLIIALAAYVAEYLREAEMFTFWIALSLLVNMVGQGLWLFSTTDFDIFSELAHIYKVGGCLIPLLGFFHYQIDVLLEYQRSERELIAAREAAESAARSKSQFLANISHEIRTPMNGILGMTHRALKLDLDSRQRECLQIVESSANQLLALLNDLLDLSKVEAGKLELDEQPFPVRTWLWESTGALAALAHDKGLGFRCEFGPDVPEHLIADAGRLRQVLVNLIGNAIKFTDRGEIAVHIDVRDQSGDRIEMHATVRDTGIGIPPEKQSEVFGAFEQADGSTTRKYGGTGLGLAISSSLVRLMHGRIWVESELGSGSRFHFIVPCRAADRPVESVACGEPNERRILPKSALPARILLVEDNEVNRRVAAGMLEDMGHEVLLASDGMQAVEQFGRQPIDLILMDLQMPILGGIDATRAIRAKEGAGKRTPIIALTAHAMTEDRDRCLAAGMDDYLSKPVDEKALFAVLERCLGATPDQPIAYRSRDDSQFPDTEHVFDRARLRQRFQGQHELLEELMRMFEQQSRELLEEIEVAASVDDLETVRRSAHKLAGSAGNFHATRLLNLARSMERSASIPTRECVEALKNELDTLRALLALEVEMCLTSN